MFDRLIEPYMLTCYWYHWTSFTGSPWSFFDTCFTAGVNSVVSCLPGGLLPHCWAATTSRS